MRTRADTKTHSDLCDQLGTQLLLRQSLYKLATRLLDDRVEAAASGVVANEKQKQAEEARLEAAKVAAQTKQIEVLTFANPALLEIKRRSCNLKRDAHELRELRPSGTINDRVGQAGYKCRFATA